MVRAVTQVPMRETVNTGILPPRIICRVKCHFSHILLFFSNLDKKSTDRTMKNVKSEPY